MSNISTKGSRAKLVAAYSRIRPSKYKDLGIITDSPEG